MKRGFCEKNNMPKSNRYGQTPHNPSNYFISHIQLLLQFKCRKYILYNNQGKTRKDHILFNICISFFDA